MFVQPHFTKPEGVSISVNPTVICSLVKYLFNSQQPSQVKVKYQQEAPYQIVSFIIYTKIAL